MHRDKKTVIICTRYQVFLGGIIGNFFLLFIGISKASCEVHVVSELLKVNNDAKWKNSVLEIVWSKFMGKYIGGARHWQHRQRYSLHEVCQPEDLSDVFTYLFES